MAATYFPRFVVLWLFVFCLASLPRAGAALASPEQPRAHGIATPAPTPVSTAVGLGLPPLTTTPTWTPTVTSTPVTSPAATVTATATLSATAPPTATAPATAKATATATPRPPPSATPRPKPTATPKPVIPAPQTFIRWPQVVTGRVVHYSPGIFAQVARNRGMVLSGLVDGYASTRSCDRVEPRDPWIVWARIDGSPLKVFEILDCSAPQDLGHHIAIGLILEVDYDSAANLARAGLPRLLYDGHTTTTIYGFGKLSDLRK